MNGILEDYTVIMALQDYMPVILSSLGLFFLARMVARVGVEPGQLAYLGWILVTLGGFNKATWKLIMAATSSQTNLSWLDNSLFVFMGPGFLCLGFAIWYAQRLLQEKKYPYFKSVFVMPLFLSAVFVILAAVLGMSNPDSRTPFFIMLGLTTISNFVVGGLVIRQGWQLGSKLVALLFAFNIGAILMLTYMARIEPQTIPLEWAAQITNTLSNMAFSYAAYRLYRMTTERVSVRRGVLAAA